MLFRTIIFVTLCFVAQSEIVFKKDCEGVGSNACQVTNVDVENCRNAPRFCRVHSGKRYPITVGFVPHFAADKIMLSTAVDTQRDGYYTTMKTTKRVCEDHQLVCPLEPYLKQTLQFDFTIAENLSGSFPARVQFWNADNATESCCFTFKVKTSLHPHQHEVFPQI